MKPLLRFSLILNTLFFGGCFVVKEAVVDTVEVGAYATKKTTHVALRTGAVAAKTTMQAGRMTAHAVSRPAEAPAPPPPNL